MARSPHPLTDARVKTNAVVGTLTLLNTPGHRDLPVTLKEKGNVLISDDPVHLICGVINSGRQFNPDIAMPARDLHDGIPYSALDVKYPPEWYWSRRANSPAVCYVSRLQTVKSLE